MGSISKIRGGHHPQCKRSMVTPHYDGQMRCSIQGNFNNHLTSLIHIRYTSDNFLGLFKTLKVESPYKYLLLSNIFQQRKDGGRIIYCIEIKTIPVVNTYVFVSSLESDLIYSYDS